jgi:hypothetical protein
MITNHVRGTLNAAKAPYTVAGTRAKTHECPLKHTLACAPLLISELYS